jgi:recombinase/recombinase-like zinc beta ribbon protein
VVRRDLRHLNGYTNHRIANGRVERRVNPAQAPVVKRIYEDAAAEQSPGKIADALKTLKIPVGVAKTGGWKDTFWTAGSVRAILRRPLYKGTVTSTWGSETFTVQHERLRIVSDALWEQVKAKRDEIRRIYLRTTGGRLAGKPPRNEAHYLLSGLLSCSVCGSVMTVRAWKKTKALVCHAHLAGRRRRYDPCPNALPLHMATAERVLLETVEHAVLQPDIITETIRKAIKKLRVKQQPAHRQQVERALHAVKLELERFTLAVANGGQVRTLVNAIQDAEQRQENLEGQLRAFEQMEQVKALDLAALEPKLRERLADWSGLASRHPLQVRQILKKILPERLTVTPNPETRSYSFQGWGRIEDLVADLLPADRSIQIWWPQGGPNAGSFPVVLPLAGRLELKAA